ncbi:MAG: hypothetical protein QM535_17400 [Limnohabitans sp.]|nr:hypothetical protein [Limnohabitans sp.]
MQSIHSLSSIVPLPEFDLWGVPPTQITVDRTYDVDYRPLTLTDQSSPILFGFSNAIDEYVKLDEIYISWNVVVKLARSSGIQSITADAFNKCHFIGYGMQAMIKQVQVEINNKPIHNLPQNYAFRAFIEALLGYGKDAKKTHLTAALWAEDFKTILTAEDATNTKSKKIYMRGKLHTDLGYQGRYLLGDSNVKIEVLLNPASFFLKLDPTLTATFEISDIVLHIKKAKVNKAIVEAHRQALKVAPVRYPIARCEIKSVVLAKGINDAIIDNFINGQIPRRMFIFMLDNDSFSGNFTKDSFYFKNYDVNFICVYIDGIPYPSQPYEPDFTTGNFVREYLGLFDALNQNNTDPLCTLEKANFKEHKCIFGFNLSPDLSNGVGFEGHSSLIKKGAVRVQIKFRTALPNPINVIAYCEYDNIIEINKFGEVSSNINV